MFKCKVTDCEIDKHQAFGYCATHYQRFHRFGDPLMLKGSPHERHGLERSKEYASWLNMKQRCLNPKSTAWENYGGRGISICNEWLNSFVTFYEDMGKCPDGLTLDRIDVNGNYEPSNCKWSTVSEQNFNQGVKGVSFDNTKQKWIVMFGNKYYGAYKDKTQAIRTRQIVENQL